MTTRASHRSRNVCQSPSTWPLTLLSQLPDVSRADRRYAKFVTFGGMWRSSHGAMWRRPTVPGAGSTRRSPSDNLTAHQFGVLVQLSIQPGVSQAALARRNLITPQSMRGVLTQMETAGLICRIPPPRRGTAISVELTEQGHTPLEQAYPATSGSSTPPLPSASARPRPAPSTSCCIACWPMSPTRWPCRNRSRSFQLTSVLGESGARKS